MNPTTAASISIEGSAADGDGSNHGVITTGDPSVVRAVNGACGFGTYDTASGSEAAPRDAPIAVLLAR